MTISEQLFAKAQQHIPGGVNSPVRAFKGVGGDPIFIKKADGAYLYDVDGNRYTDYVGSWGPMIMGHNHPKIKAAVLAAVENGLSYGAPTESEITMAELVKKLVPSMEKVRMVNSGTEATMTAIRLARGYTNKNKILKFEGCYHGHADSFLIKAGSGALTLGVPNSPGVPDDFAKHTLTAQFNDLESVKQLFAQCGDDIACIIVEPVAGNMNCIPPNTGFLEGLRQICDDTGALLIFDEVMTGFRVSLGGAQGYYGVEPDLTTLGKVIGGGMPVGAFGGKLDVMNHIAPDGPVYQAGTLSGNPIAMAAGITALSLLLENKDSIYPQLDRQAKRLCEGFKAAAEKTGIALTTNQVGGMFGFFFTDAEHVTNFNQATQCDIARFQKFYHLMLEQGIYLAPSAYEAGFNSTALTDDDIEATINAAEKAFQQL